jgi:hypothetical protein
MAACGSAIQTGNLRPADYHLGRFWSRCQARSSTGKRSISVTGCSLVDAGLSGFTLQERKWLRVPAPMVVVIAKPRAQSPTKVSYPRTSAIGYDVS